jgi:trigger factor
MKVQVEQESPIQKKLEISVDADLIKKHLDAAFVEIGKKAKLKGFRPGKVPRQVLEQYYLQDAENKAVQTLIDQTYTESLIQEQIRPLSYPKVEIKSFDPANELVYVARVEVKPELGALKGYKGLNLKQDPVDVKDSELKDRLKLYEERNAKLVPIDPPRKLKKGDVVIFDYEALREGKAFEGNKVEDYTAELGTGTLLKEFEDQLFDAKPGDSREIDVTLPDNFADKNFAGKKMHYSVVLKEIKQKIMPKLDDDFAKDLGHENLKVFKDSVQEEMKRTKENVNRNKLHREIISELIKLNDIPVPESMIEAELAGMYNQFTQNLKQQGQTPDGLGVTHETFRQQNLEEAELRIKGMLIFERIWTDESISVSDEERGQKIDNIAQMTGQRKLEIRQYYEANSERMGQLDVLILQDKTLDFILSEAKIETKKT